MLNAKTLGVQTKAAGWDSLGDDYALVKGTVNGVGRRTRKSIKVTAERLIAWAAQVDAWDPLPDLGDPIPQHEDDYNGWPTSYALRVHYGVSPDLMKLVETRYPEGEWVLRDCPLLPELPFVVARLSDSEPVALLAPMTRNDKVTATNQNQRPEEGSA